MRDGTWTRVRELANDVLPKKSVGIELGVFEGVFANMILEVVKPTEFHLVDVWRPLHADDVSLDELETAKERVYGRFKSEIASGRVIVHEMMTAQAASEFGTQYFDWVYVDASHDYQSVKQDLTLYWPLLKYDGVMLGDNFQPYAPKARNLGVIPAVMDFLKAMSNAKFLGTTGELYPKFVMRKVLR